MNENENDEWYELRPADELDKLESRKIAHEKLNHIIQLSQLVEELEDDSAEWKDDKPNMLSNLDWIKGILQDLDKNPLNTVNVIVDKGEDEIPLTVYSFKNTTSGRWEALCWFVKLVRLDANRWEKDFPDYCMQEDGYYNEETYYSVKMVTSSPVSWEELDERHRKLEEEGI